MITQENITTLTFKEIVNELNLLVSDIKVMETIDPSDIKDIIFDIINNYFVNITNVKIQSIDYNHNKFRIAFPIVISHKGINELVVDIIYITLRIQTSKTDKLKKISPTRKKYIHTNHKTPIKFDSCEYDSSSAPSFKQKDDYKIIKSGSLHGHVDYKRYNDKYSITTVLEDKKYSNGDLDKILYVGLGRVYNNNLHFSRNIPTYIMETFVNPLIKKGFTLEEMKSDSSIIGKYIYELGLLEV